jgi:CubicO group peptidase (beta-lactamase class C family)
MPGHALDPVALDRAFALARRQVADGTAPFVILGVANAAGTIRLEAASPAGEPRLGADAVCLVASITKPIVATAVMQLVAEGRLALGAPIAAVLPELRRPGTAGIAPWHLLGHTSGLGDVDIEALIERGASAADVLAEGLRLEPRTAPGSAYRYVSVTYDLLAEAVARIDGVPFADALRRRILDPLGMTATTFDPRPALAARMAPVRLAGDATGGAAAPGVRSAEVDAFTNLRLAGGGLWSSAADLLRFGRAMLRGGELDGVRVLPSAHLALMRREVTVGGIGAAADPLLADHYALGWGRPRADTVGSADAFGHGGATGTRLWIDPERDLVFVYLTGHWGFPLEPVDAVMHAVYAALP